MARPFVSLLLLAFSLLTAGLAVAQQSSPPIQITSPLNGAVFAPGSSIPVTVATAPNITLGQVAIVGQFPIGASTVLTSSPFQFSLAIPSDADLGANLLTAIGTTTTGQLAMSDPVTVDVERPDFPVGLSANPNQMEFEAIGEALPFTITGTFADGTTADLSASSNTSYSSANSTVVTVDSRGVVTALSPGTTSIIAVYGQPSKTLQVTVAVEVLPFVTTLTPTALSFAGQVVGIASAPQTVTLTNASQDSLSIIQISTGGDFSEVDNCASSSPLPLGGSCVLNITFLPTAVGIRPGSLSVTNSFNTIPDVLALAGTGTGAGPGVTLSATNLNFSSQLVTTASAAQTVALTNSGTANVNITGITLTGANIGDFSQTNTCGASVAVAANCTISVTFKPTATGSRSASVSIADDATGSPQIVTLTGTGTDFSIDAASGSSTSASVTAGQTATYNLQVTPLGGFSGNVALSCSGAPSLATCTVSPAAVTPNGAVASAFTATVTTTASSMIVPRTVRPGWPPFTGLRLVYLLVLALASLAILGLFRDAASLYRRGLALTSALAVVLLILAWMAGCGGGGGGGGVQHNSGTPKGSVTVTITGTSGGASHALSLTLTVN
jgi:hypothetical protein